MPVQTTGTSYIYFPDGCKVQVKESGGSYEDLGAINSAASATLDYTENQVDTANAGKLLKQIRDMVMSGSFTLINLNPSMVAKMGGGMFETVTTAGTTVVDADITDQAISGYTAGVRIPLNPVITASGKTLKFSAAPVLTSVTASTSGVLAANDDYFIVLDASTDSGYSILFNGSGTATVGTSETITIDFGDNDPVANTAIYAGTSTQTLTPYAMKFTHTDSAGLIRELELFSVDTNSGGFQFSFKGANEDGVEEMPLAFSAKLDTTLTDGRQLMKWSIDQGAA
jgi:hypothetical protein